MCNRIRLSDNIIRLSVRTYRRKFDVIEPDKCNAAQLTRLCHDLDALYESLADEFNSMTADDCRLLVPQIDILLATTKELFEACKQIPKLERMAEEIEMIYYAIYEVRSDMISFRINAPQNKRLKASIERVKASMRNAVV